MIEKNFSDNENEYVPAYPPDKVKLSVYIMQAKGDNRTMAEFASACKSVSASTFSRIVNGKITKPLSKELIGEIIANAADTAGFDYDSLMRANGMIPREEQENARYANEERRKYTDALINTRREIRNIIAENLYDRGCTLRFFQSLPNGELSKSGFGLRLNSGFAVRVQGYEPLYWNFVMCFSDPGIDAAQIADRTLSRHLTRIMNSLSGLFLRDAWEPETLKDIKNSVIFTQSEIYDGFCNMIRQVKVNSDISVILIDIEKRTVARELTLPRYDKKEFSSIFEREIMAFDEENL